MPNEKIVLIVLDGKESECEVCGKKAELRPYGKFDSAKNRRLSICFECGMKNEKETDKAFGEIIDG